jgi:formylglycine-generating enzyme required for sulfatase activity
MKSKLIALCLVFVWQYPYLKTGQAQDRPTAKSDSIPKLPIPEMVVVEGGTFRMGTITDPSGQGTFNTRFSHQVSLSSFQIGKYEVTQAEWLAVMGTNLSLHQGCDNCPVEEVSWNDVQLFIRTLNEKSGKNYQLPTAAQWEFAARGGNKSKGYKYAGSNDMDEVGWFGGEFIDQTHPVGRKHPNEIGIYDMSGNVAEWCSDWFDPNYDPGPQTNPQGPLPGVGHVVRGSSWGAGPSDFHVLGGRIGYPNDRSAHVGFRLVLVP